MKWFQDDLCLALVFNQLSPKECIILSRVCARFYRIITRDNTAWRRHMDRILQWCPHVELLFPLVTPSGSFYRVLTEYLLPPIESTLYKYRYDKTGIFDALAICVSHLVIFQAEKRRYKVAVGEIDDIGAWQIRLENRTIQFMLAGQHLCYTNEFCDLMESSDHFGIGFKNLMHDGESIFYTNPRVFGGGLEGRGIQKK